MTIEYRSARYADAATLVPKLRDSDRIELYAIHRDPLWAMTVSLDVSTESFATLEDGELIALGGMATDDANQTAIPWLVGSDRVYEQPHSLIRAARRMLSRYLDYPRFRQAVWSNNEESMVYLEALGFKPISGVVINNVTFMMYERPNV